MEVKASASQQTKERSEILITEKAVTILEARNAVPKGCRMAYSDEFKSTWAEKEEFRDVINALNCGVWTDSGVDLRELGASMGELYGIPPSVGVDIYRVARVAYVALKEGEQESGRSFAEAGKFVRKA